MTIKCVLERVTGTLLCISSKKSQKSYKDLGKPETVLKKGGVLVTYDMLVPNNYCKQSQIIAMRKLHCVQITTLLKRLSFYDSSRLTYWGKLNNPITRMTMVL